MPLPFGWQLHAPELGKKPPQKKMTKNGAGRGIYHPTLKSLWEECFWEECYRLDYVRNGKLAIEDVACGNDNFPRNTSQNPSIFFRVSYTPSMLSSCNLRRKQEDICALGVPALKSVGLACVKNFLEQRLGEDSSKKSTWSKWLRLSFQHREILKRYKHITQWTPTSSTKPFPNWLWMLLPGHQVIGFQGGFHIPKMDTTGRAHQKVLWPFHGFAVHT